MPTAHIFTRFPERAAPLRKTLADSGYRVEILRPGQSGSRTADVEYDLDSMPEYASAGPVSSAEPAAPLPVSTPVVSPPAPQRKDPGPSRFTLLKDRLAGSSRALQEKIAQERAARAERDRQRLAAQIEQHRLREIELAEKRRIAETIAIERRKREAEEAAARQEAQRAAAERAREQAAARQAELQRQNELRRLEQEKLQAEAGRRAQLAADHRARLEAERRADPQPIVPRESFRPAIDFARVRQDAAKKWNLFRERATKTFSDWRELSPRERFTNTRDYAWRQVIPAAAGLAAAFIFGWALAAGNVQHAANKSTSATSSSTPVVAAPIAPVAAVAVAPVHAAPSSTKPSAVKRKATVAKGKYPVSRSRRHKSDEELANENDEEVIVVHHRLKRGSQLAATKKDGVKTISDME